MIISPYQFVGNFSSEGAAVDYTETRELGQGGPILGTISINGSPVLYQNGTAEFGGPFVVGSKHIYAPLLSGFRFLVAMIDIKSRKVIALSDKDEQLILIQKVADNTVFYFNDLSNQNLKSYTF